LPSQRPTEMGSDLAEHEGDLRAIARMLGMEMSAVILGLPVGYSIFHLAESASSS